ncbi:MAG: hypothetical protein R2779_07860 [Crocinitomicaceae bacterium]
MNSSFDKQTLKDLEFPTIQQWLEKYAVGPTAKARINQLEPSNDFKAVETELLKSNELLAIRKTGEQFPSLDFEELTQEIKLLAIKNAVLSQEGFYTIRLASNVANQLVYFLINAKKIIHFWLQQ